MIMCTGITIGVPKVSYLTPSTFQTVIWHFKVHTHCIAIFSIFNSADKDAQKGKKSARKTTRAGGSGIDLQKVAEEQQVKLEKEREERKEQIKAAQEAAAAAPPPESPPAPSPAKAPAVVKPKTGKNESQKVKQDSTCGS